MDKRRRRRGENGLGNGRWELPPLILHPFADSRSPETLLEGSRAGIRLHGLLPLEDNSMDDLTRQLLAGRLCEIRMLYFLGKDLCRWIGQCLDFSARTTGLEGAGLSEQSFGHLLVEDPPAAVQGKLREWGVRESRTIFGRALALDAVFREPPSGELLNLEFIKNYYFYADQVYCCWMDLVPYQAIGAANFQFELYASGEYTKRLERAWGEDDHETA